MNVLPARARSRRNDATVYLHDRFHMDVPVRYPPAAASCCVNPVEASKMRSGLFRMPCPLSDTEKSHLIADIRLDEDGAALSD